MESNFKARRELFQELIGKEKYTGSMEQNMLLLRTLKQRQQLVEKDTKAHLTAVQSELNRGTLKKDIVTPPAISKPPVIDLPNRKSEEALAGEDSIHEKMSEMRERYEISTLLKKIDYHNLGSLNTAEIPYILIDLKRLHEEGHVSLAEIQKHLIPPTEYVLGMFYSDRFVNQELPHLEKSANVSDNHPYRKFVARIKEAVPHARTMRDRYHVLITEYVRIFGDATHDFSQISPLFPRGVANMPSDSELSQNHQDAIDIFFQSSRNGVEEIGPEIRAMNGGMVLAASDNWRGGGGIETYQSGGIAPKVGNGVMIFNPQTEEYSEYAHLSSVAVKAGDIISAGTVIGRGGNTGSNARKPGHGNHVHFEIHKKEKNQHIAMTPRSIAERIRKLA